MMRDPFSVSWHEKIMPIMAIVISVSIVLFILIAALRGITMSVPDYKNMLEAQGYKRVGIGDHPIFGCANEDAYFMSVKFNAVHAVSNKYVNGVVCCGYFKDCTIRINP